jgi:serine protease Do
LAKALNLPQPAGFLVQRVGAGSIGSSLSLNPGTMRATIQGTDIILGGDVILSVNEIQITAASTADQVADVASDDSYERIYNCIGALKLGDNLVVRVFREGRVLTLSAPVER